MTFKNGLSATACTEQISDSYWFLLIYDPPYEKFIVECTPETALWDKYEEQIISILDTVVLQG